jgi:Cof subfamily protein (haloacid dehalogenase superfamily)
MAYRLIALDIDGTLLNSQRKVSERTRKAIDSARENGVVVTLVTGRRFASARLLAMELGLDSALISHNGALTKNASTLEIIDYHPLRASTARDLIKIGHEQDADFILCEDPIGLGRVVVENKSVERNERLASYLSYVNEYGLTVEVIDKMAEREIEDLIQVMYTGTVQKMDGLSSLIESTIGNNAKRQWTTYRDSDMTILDLLNPKCSKAHGVAALARSLQISNDEIIAIGDNYNDVEMLQMAGLGIIMANAEPGLKAMGFTETKSNDEDGVALAIEQNVL